MNTQEINAIIIEKMTEARGTYDSVHPEVNKNFEKNRAANPDAYRSPCNWSYIQCEAGPDLLAFVLRHPEFSHFTHRDRYSVTVYWHHDTAPNRVVSVAAFDPKRMQEAHRLRGDEIAAAMAWASGYDD
jgi:hypothetical protein